MKKIFLFAITLMYILSLPANAQPFKDKATDAVEKPPRNNSFNDMDINGYAKKSIEWMDAHNPVAHAGDKYVIRLNKIFTPHLNEDGLALNFKVYNIPDINAFACADGSIRVCAGLMDIMTDEELLAITGHEIGHIKNHDSRDAIISAYINITRKHPLTSHCMATTLSQSQLAVIAKVIMSSSHSREQETGADDYSYDFLKKHNYSVKLADLSDGTARQSRFQKMFDSHPDNKARAEEIQKKAKKDGLWKEPVFLVYDGTGARE